MSGNDHAHIMGVISPAVMEAAVETWKKELADGLTPEASLTLTLAAVLPVHAHELAEKIRTELPERAEKLTGNWAEIRTVQTAQRAADLIDPEVEGG